MNPFDAFGIDPTLGPAAITAYFRGRMEVARDDDERNALRNAWEALVGHPRDRVIHALRAMPPRGATPGKPPPRKRAVRPEVSVEAEDFVVLPAIGDGLGADLALSDNPFEDPLLAGAR